MIKLNRLKLNNFLSHVNTDLPLKDYEGLVLIEGITADGHYSSNGAGKSSILEGIVYAMTGNTLRGVSVNDVVNRNYKKDAMSSLNLQKGDVEYEISRYRKDKIHGDNIVVTKEGNDISKRVNKETQAMIDDVLGISYKILVSTILLGEGMSSRFTQLSDPEKKSLIESTLNMNYDISAIRSKASAKLGELKLDRSNLEGRIATLKSMASLDVEGVKERIAQSKRDIEQYNLTEKEMSEEVDRLNAEKSIIDNKVNLLRDSINQCNVLLSEIQKLDNENLKLVHELEETEKASVPCCTVCHQTLESEESREAFRANYRERIESLTNRILELRTQLEKLPDKSLLEEKYKSLCEESHSLHDKAFSVIRNIDEIHNKVWAEESNIKTLTNQIESYEEFNSSIDSLETEYSEVSKDIEKYDYFYRLFSPTGIIVNILSDAIEYINTRLSTYSEVLLEKDYHINFVKGKISLVDSKGSSYQSLSNGEKRRLDIAIQFSLHDYIHAYCGMKVDTIFIDEILDTLDDVGVDNIFDVLRLKLEYCGLKSVFVITHNNSLKSKFDRVVTIKKDEKGDSYIV